MGGLLELRTKAAMKKKQEADYDGPATKSVTAMEPEEPIDEGVELDSKNRRLKTEKTESREYVFIPTIIISTNLTLQHVIRRKVQEEVRNFRELITWLVSLVTSSGENSKNYLRRKWVAVY